MNAPTKHPINAPTIGINAVNAINVPTINAYGIPKITMAITKSAKIQAEIEKVKAKIAEQQTRLKELEQKKLEAENSEIVDIVRGMSVSLEELPLVLQQLRGASGHGGQRIAERRTSHAVCERPQRLVQDQDENCL